jgi:hypothetical protein
MKRIIFISILSIFVGLITNAQFDSIVSQLNNYNRKNLNEQVYLHSDRDVYYPGDTIWFKAYIRKRMFLNESNLSQELYVRLVNDKGVEMSNQKYFIDKSQASGQININNNIDEGYYYLLANTSWMENFDMRMIYAKKIFIKNEVVTKYRIEPILDKNIYFPGDTVRMRLQCYDNFNRSINDFSYKYIYTYNNKPISNRAYGIAEQQFMLDSFENVVPKIQVKGRYKDQILDTLFEIPSTKKLDVSFFPEGGRCINGLIGTVAFKAIYSNGSPANIKGYVTNEFNERITDIATEYNGMGSFLFMPEEDVKYYFVVEGSKYNGLRFELPKGLNQGWQLKTSFQKNNKIIVDVNKLNPATETALITLKIRDCIVHYNIIQIGLHAEISINTDSLPSGVGVISVFDNKLYPQAERLVFVNHKNTSKIKLELNKNSYTVRDSVQLKVKISDNEGIPLNGVFSVSIFDNELGSIDQIDESNIVASSFLASEIKGNIEHPNYYFSSDSISVMRHLDLLLLTQGWRCYNYLSQNDSLKNPVKQEYIRGQLKRFKFGVGLVPTKGKITLFNIENGTQFTTDDTGYFSIRPIYEQGANTNLVLSSVDLKSRTNVSLCINPNPYDEQLSKYLKTNINIFNQYKLNPIHTYHDQAIQDSINSKNNFWIDEIVVKAKKKDRDQDPMINLINSVNNKKAKKETLMTASNMEEVLLTMSPQYDFDQDPPRGYYFGVNNTGFSDRYNTDIYFYADGHLELYENVKRILPKNVKELYLVKGPFAALVFGSPLTFVLNTEKKDYYADDIYPSNLYYVKEFTVAKEFYSPKYNSNVKYQQGINDMRRTLFWTPSLKIDENGAAIIKFYNGDRYSKMKCVIEGFTIKNEPLHSECFYNVAQ